MKIQTAVPETVTNSVNQGAFTIKNSAKAFGILSSGLYSNKILAVVRELSCNAYDSHTESGNLDPFIVHLPNSWEPWFSVQDYGLGLSTAQVRGIYTTYFESTKTDSNDFIGGLGLGSKSPFAYCDNFTVTAVKNGKKSIFSAFIDETGCPSLADMLIDQPTNERNGVEVRLAVKESDFYAFNNAANKVFRWFDRAPKVLNARNPIEKVALTELCPGAYIMLDSNIYRASYNPLVRMGNVVYPVEIQSLKNHPEYKKVESISFSRMIFDVKIGEVDIQASRESLSYIPLTVNFLVTRLLEIIKHTTDQIAEHNDPLTGWALAIKLQEYAKLSELSNVAARDLHAKYSKDPKRQLPVADSIKFKTNPNEYGVVVSGYHTLTNKSSKYRHMSASHDTLRMTDDCLFVINDRGSITGILPVIHHYLKENSISGIDYVFVISPAEGHTPEFEAYLDHHLCRPIPSRVVKRTEMTKPPAVPKVTKPFLPDILLLTGSSYSGFSLGSVLRETVSSDTSITKWYIPFAGSIPDNTAVNSFIETPTQLIRALNQMVEELNIRDIKLVKINKLELKQIAGKADWKNLLDELVKYRNDNLELIKLRSISGTVSYNNRILSKITTNEPDILSVQKNTTKYCMGYRNFMSSAETALIDIEVTALSKRINERFPLLEHLMSSTPIKLVEQYINDIVSKRNNESAVPTMLQSNNGDKE